MLEPFYGFPHTPYLISPNNTSSRLDKVLSEDGARPFFTDAVLIEEKIDGANLGISFTKDGTICLQNRGHYLSKPFTGQWKPLPCWLNSRIDCLFDLLLNKFILFGEWCYVTHSVHYCSLPDWFIAFDLFDKDNQCFLSTKKRNALIAKAGIAIVPQLYKGHMSISMLSGFLGKSEYGDEECEGLYFRIDSEEHVIHRAKYVRPGFQQLLDAHWSKKAIRHNQLRKS